MSTKRTNPNSDGVERKTVLFADASKSERSRRTTHRRPADDAASSDENNRCRPSSRSSAPVPLPEAHIRRTHSEIQLADETIRAECKDVAMYSRLMTGIFRRMQHRQREDNVPSHLMKSMMDIARTKEADDYHLEHHDRNGSDHDCDGGWDAISEHHDGEVDDCGWDIYSPIDGESERSWLDSSDTSCSTMSSRESSNETHRWTLPPDDECSGILDDDCIFSMDM